MEHQEWRVCCEFQRAAPTRAGGPVVVNEIADGRAGEWVELYNAGSELVDIQGWTLHTQSLYPDVRIDGLQQSLEPLSFLTVEAKLKDGNDKVTLLDASGRVVSQLSWGYGVHGNGFSVGRYPDGYGEHVVAMQPSPDKPNSCALPPRPGAPEGAPPAMNASGWLPPAPERPRPSGEKVQRLHYFTVGNGGDLGRHAEPAETTKSRVRFFQRRNGFFALQASEQRLLFSFVDDSGNEVHSGSVSGS